MRSVQASDFVIGEFKILRRLLFFHGRSNNNRISKFHFYNITICLFIFLYWKWTNYN